MRAGFARVVGLSLLLATGLSEPLKAQDEEPPPEYFATGGSWLSRYHLSPYGDARFRFDRVRDRPGATEDLERVRGKLRGGLVFSPRPWAAFEAGLYTGLWPDDDDPPAATFDNEHSDSIAADRLAAVITPDAMLSITLGKRPLPLTTSDLTWDSDLRPVGVTIVARRAVRVFDEARAAVAAVRRSEVGGDDALMALQLAYALQPGAARGAEIVVGIADYSGLDALAAEGLGRQNRLVSTSSGTQYANSFRTIEGQLAGRMQIRRLLGVAAAHFIHNLEVDQEGEGVRLRGSLGDLAAGSRVEVGYVFQRIEREALPGAYNSDDWWFHTRARGHRVWLAVRPVRGVTARVSGFHERRDDVTTPTRRLLIDLDFELPHN